MFEARNLFNTVTPDANKQITQQMGAFYVLEYVRDMSVTPNIAQTAYFCNLMNIRKRQVICDLKKADITLQSGAMQWMVGPVKVNTGITGAGDLAKKFVKGKASGESTIKPEYSGEEGILVLEPTYKHIILSDIRDWGGKVILDDGLFLACEACIDNNIVSRSNISSALLGGEGLFNLCLSGDEGVFCIESPTPMSEIVEVYLKNDVLKIDGNLAIAWSASLSFTVERTTKTLIGSAASGEGLVNTYRGTGKVWMTPVKSSL